MAGFSGNGLEGMDRVMGVLNNLKDKAAVKLSKTGVSAGLTPLKQALVSAVNASSAPDAVKSEARKTIGKRLVKTDAKIIVGKVGFGVGRRSEAKKAKAAARAGLGGKGGESKGVGISAADIHWFVLGTAERFRGSKRVYDKTTKSYKQVKTESPNWRTGQIQPMLGGLVTQAVASSGPAMLEAARAKVSQVLAQEAAKGS